MPLEQWESDRLVDMPTGLHRHVVRFVEYDRQIYALKELPQRLAEREYRLLRTMNERELPVVAAVALVDRRGDPQPVLVTRYLNHALPFRHLFAEETRADIAVELVESFATLLARLHNAGLFWGDGSLSNALFRRDELHISGYALDTETAELHDQLTEGQRRADVDIAVVNIAGGLADLAAAGHLGDLDPFEIAPQVEAVYDEIWAELGAESSYDPQDPQELNERLERLHELGFDVEEAIITDDDESGSFSFRPSSIADGYHRRELRSLTGIVAREHQARRLLQEIRAFRETIEHDIEGHLDLRDVGHRWLSEVYDPVIASIPHDATDRLELPQRFIDALDRDAPG